jgi:hypothetical protein
MHHLHTNAETWKVYREVKLKRVETNMAIPVVISSSDICRALVSVAPLVAAALRRSQRTKMAAQRLGRMGFEKYLQTR